MILFQFQGSPLHEKNGKTRRRLIVGALRLRCQSLKRVEF
jgi:hypothetical protein